jgi:hypothetical protein
MYKMSAASRSGRSMVRKILSNGCVRRQTTPSMASARNTTDTSTTASSSRTCTEPDFAASSAAMNTHYSCQDRHMDALITATASRPYNAFKPQAYEMDLVLASRAKYSFDKVLLLMQHGEDESQTSSSSIQDPPLTGEGFGQALDLSRKAAVYCNPQAGLEPELMVVSPFSRVLQTTLLAFPYSKPGASSSSIGNKKTPWICHPALVDASGDLSNHPMEISDLQLTFPGMDYSLYTDDNDEDEDDYSTSTTPTTPSVDSNITLLESKEQLLHQADQFVRWLQGRPERVVVGKWIDWS